MGYDRMSRILHWLTALIVLAMIPAGLIMTSVDDRAVQDPLFIFHKNAGALLILLIVVRLAWRMTHKAPPLPDSLPAVQKFAARGTHVALYFLLVVMAVSGYVRVRAGGFPVELLDTIGVPNFIPRDDALAQTAKSIHARAKFGIGLFIALHVGAAAYHGLVRRDGIFSRMWPPTARASAARVP